MTVASLAPVLSTRGLTKVYPGMRALDQFDIDLAPGEIHGVVGANGAGKSTLIKILAGHQSATSGIVRVDGEEVAIHSAAQAQRLGISVVHQELPMLPNLTAAQNVVVGREGRGLLAPARRRAARRDYRRLITQLAGAPSPGTQLDRVGLASWQVVAILRALDADARVLVLDEPTSSLTVDERNALHARLRSLAAEGLAILYVSHFLDDILDVSQTVTVLRDGRLAHRGPASALDEDLLLAHMTGGVSSALADPVPTPRTPVATTPRAAGLRIRGLSVGTTTLNRLDVAPGEIVGLYGLEGSGARDVVEAVFGLLPRTGEVTWNGNVVGGSPRQAIRAGVTLVTGDRKRSGIGTGTVATNHGLPRLARLPLVAPAPRRAIRADAARSIADFRVKGTADQALGMLSGGNQQKVLLARWVDSERPLCMALDEPTHGVDVGGRRAIYEQLRRFVDRGNAVLLHSTDPDEVVELCHRAIPFSGGRPLAEIHRADLSIDHLEHMVRASSRHHSLLEET
ncbi:MAG: sugar ABC transporter ATP-binding protein [Nocardioidaceae bacterium]